MRRANYRQQRQSKQSPLSSDQISTLVKDGYQFWYLGNSKKTKEAHCRKNILASRENPIRKYIDLFPYLLRLRELYWICPWSWVIFIISGVLEALIPAVNLHFSVALFEIFLHSIDQRELDQTAFLWATVGAGACNLTRSVLSTYNISERVKREVNLHFDLYLFDAFLRLDLPTSQDPGVASKFQRHSHQAAPWGAVNIIRNTAGSVVQLGSQLFVLRGLLKNNPGTYHLAIWSFVGLLLKWYLQLLGPESFVARRTDPAPDIHAERKAIVCFNPSPFRQELVAGNYGQHIKRDFVETMPKHAPLLPDQVWEKHRSPSYRGIFIRLLQDVCGELPKVAFALQALRTPRDIPLSLVALNVVQDQMLTVTSLMLRMYHDQSSFYHLLLSIKEFYELASIPNQVQDGTERFPSSVKPGEGVSVRFENVSFRYPGSDSFALKNVNFDIKAGGLCVIVGMNGEGKSSILKLLPRLFDPTEGTIYLDNLPINRYRLLDLRKSLNVLFQDFQTFPMTIKEGVRLGSNTIEYEDEQVREALKLGGAEGFVNELPMKEDTNLSHLRQYFSFSGPEANDIFYAIPEDIRLSSKDTRTNLSGGQKQRLALSRTFMRKPEEVSLLVYDEPSAALDPQAEFDLFERLRVLKGNKTMIFSTHRFGYLTRYADIILFMKDSTIAEAGTHQELMSIPDGGYAKLYTLQAQAFSK